MRLSPQFVDSPELAGGRRRSVGAHGRAPLCRPFPVCGPHSPHRSKSPASGQQKSPTATGTVGLPWFHPGSRVGPGVRPDASAPSLAVTPAGVAAYSRLSIRWRSSIWEPGSEVVFAARPAREFQPVLPSLFALAATLLVLVVAFAIRLSSQYTAGAAVEHPGFSLQRPRC
jgi:hypothetical protein